MLVGEEESGAAKAALNFIEDEECAVPLGELAGAGKKFLADRTNAALALNCLDAKGTDRGVKLAFQIFYVVESNERNARNQRLERIAIFGLPCGREGAESASVERAVEGEKARLPWLRRTVGAGALGLAVRAGYLQRALPGFGAAVAEEGAVEARGLGKNL